MHRTFNQCKSICSIVHITHDQSLHSKIAQLFLKLVSARFSPWDRFDQNFAIGGVLVEAEINMGVLQNEH